MSFSIAEYSEGVFVLEKAFKRAYARYMPKETESSDDEFSMRKDGEKSQKANQSRKSGGKTKKNDDVSFGINQVGLRLSING